MKQTLPELFDYGIQNEESDLRTHVCFKAGIVYVFETSAGRKAIERYDYKDKFAGQPGVNGPTGKGKAVPIEAIRGVTETYIPDLLIRRYPIFREDDTSVKGRKAEAIVKEIIRAGRFPFPNKWNHVNPACVDIQHVGVDLIVIYPHEIRIQVKCDYLGGSKMLGGTGNLFLQTAERNPKRKF